MAAGEHHRGFAGEDVPGVIDHRGRHHADVADVAATVEQALDQLLHQFRAGQAAIAAHGNVRLALRQALRANRATDPVSGFRGQAAADHAANVIGAEDIGRQFWRDLRGIHNRGVLQSQEVLVFIENVDIEDIGVLKQRIDQVGRSARRYGCRCSGVVVAACCRRRLRGAPRYTGQGLRQVVECWQAQAEGFDGFTG
ncbi:hypothetical protein D9M68_796910 [compost metagenome]